MVVPPSWVPGCCGRTAESTALHRAIVEGQEGVEWAVVEGHEGVERGEEEGQEGVEGAISVGAKKL